MTTLLHTTIDTAHHGLADRRERAAAAMADRIGHREIVRDLDDFLIAASRHTAAVCDVLLPAARRYLPDGRAKVHAYVVQCRRTERALVRAKQRIYGEARMATATWTTVWADAVSELRVLHELELELVRGLASLPETRLHLVATRIAHATLQSPTRPHPNSPHTGSLSHVLRGLWARADRFWDAAEGRIASGRRPVPPAQEEQAA